MKSVHIMSTFTDLITSDDAFFLSLFTPVYTGSVAVQETKKPEDKPEDWELPEGWKQEDRKGGKKRTAEGEAEQNAIKKIKLTKTTAELKDSIINPPTNLNKTTAIKKIKLTKTTANRKDQGSTTTRPPWKP